MQTDILIAAIFVLVSVVGLLIIIRPRPIKAVKKNLTTNEDNNLHGWGTSE